MGRAIVTNGDRTAYVCDSTATRPSSQIALHRLVFRSRYLAIYCDISFLAVETISVSDPEFIRLIRNVDILWTLTAFLRFIALCIFIVAISATGETSKWSGNCDAVISRTVRLKQWLHLK